VDSDLWRGKVSRWVDGELVSEVWKVELCHGGLMVKWTVKCGGGCLHGGWIVKWKVKFGGNIFKRGTSEY